MMFRRSATLAALLLLAACAPRPIPIPPPVPPARVVQATIRASDGGALASTLTATLSTDHPFSVPCRVAIEASRVVCLLDARFPIGDAAHVYGGHLELAAEGYVSRVVHFGLTGQSQDLPDVFLDPVFVPLPRLVISGKFFALATGARWTAIEATDFHLFGRYLAGENIDGVLEQRRAIGFNLLRVWTAYDVCASGIGCQAIGRLTPREHPDYYARLPRFLDHVARFGLYVELVAFTGRWETTLPSDADKIAHWDRLVAAVSGSTNVIVELVNEHDHPANAGLPYDRLARPAPPLLASHGSGQADSVPKLPIWDFGTYHPGFGEEWTRKAIHNGMEDVADPYNVPVLLNETTRFPDNESRLDRAFDVGRGCALLQAGCAFHSVEGKNSRLFEASLPAAREFARGARSMNLECQRGFYTRIDDPAFLRVYERRGVAPGCRVEVRR